MLCSTSDCTNRAYYTGKRSGKPPYCEACYQRINTAAWRKKNPQAHYEQRHRRRLVIARQRTRQKYSELLSRLKTDNERKEFQELVEKWETILGVRI